jgi:hypothetical protein
METLEGRVVLSGLPDMAFVGPAPEETGAMTDEARCLDSAITETDLFGETDPVIQAPPGGGGGPGGSGDPGEPGDPQQPGNALLPPVIFDFGAYIEGNVLCVTGFVSDDKEVGGLTVRFGGEVEGRTASVDPDGFFELLLEVPRDFEGMIYAQTTDVDGLDSEMVSTHVH